MDPIQRVLHQPKGWAEATPVQCSVHEFTDGRGSPIAQEITKDEKRFNTIQHNCRPSDTDVQPFKPSGQVTWLSSRSDHSMWEKLRRKRGTSPWIRTQGSTLIWNGLTLVPEVCLYIIHIIKPGVKSKMPILIPRCNATDDRRKHGLWVFMIHAQTFEPQDRP